MEQLLNQWHCDDTDCNKIFFIDLEEQPNICPFCRSEYLSDSKVLEVKPLTF